MISCSAEKILGKIPPVAHSDKCKAPRGGGVVGRGIFVFLCVYICICVILYLYICDSDKCKAPRGGGVVGRGIFVFLCVYFCICVFLICVFAAQTNVWPRGVVEW